jgi:hypothetical protein
MDIVSYKTEGKDMKYASFLVMMAAVIAVLLAAGCTSAPVKETSTTNVSVTESQATPKSSVSVTEPQAAVKYVELNLLDESKVGGKYVSESAAFVTIVPMYVLDKDGFMSVGSGNEVGIKSSFVNTMVNIDDPSSYVAATLKAQSDKPKPKTPSRKVTFNLDGTPYTLAEDRVDTSIPGYVTQITILERSKGNREPAAFVEVDIKTIIDESLKPANKEKAIQEATDSYIDGISTSGATIDENPAYDAPLANGNKVTVRQLKKVPFVYNSRINVFSYMPDSNTIVTVASSENKQVFDEVIRTLNIGEMQNLQ